MKTADHIETTSEIVTGRGVNTRTALASCDPRQGNEQVADMNVIRPFQVNVPEADLVALRQRIKATVWPDRETVSDQSQGPQLATMQRIASYWENWGKLGYFNVKGVSIPVAVSVFPNELYPAPRTWTERAYPNLVHYNKLAKGGHFAAWEQPSLFSKELRAGFKSLR